MRVVIAGGSGFIGSMLAGRIVSEGNRVTILTRNRYREMKSAGLQDYRYWDPSDPNSVIAAVNGADAVVNLAGESVAAKRWSGRQKEKILRSRIGSTRALAEAIQSVENKPSVFVSASAIGIYNHDHKAVHTEASEPGNSFLAAVCRAWENEAEKVDRQKIRTVIVRIGIVLSKKGGALERMVLPFKLFAGGPLGSGKQWMQWVHIEDVAGIFSFALGTPHVNGILNATSPNQLTNAEFSKILGTVLRRPSLIPVPGFVLKMLMGEMAEELLLKGQQVLPERTLEMGYSFKYPYLEEALRDLFK